ncbi:MAG: hypothetical protein ACRD2O_01495 [Terriglobia bacterium]
MTGPDPTQPNTEIPDPATPESATPAPVLDEPFPCPSCGQLLGPKVRVCVACGQPVDLSKLHAAAPPAPELPAIESAPASPSTAVERARFSWGIFIVVLAVWLSAAFAGQRFLSPLHERFFLAGIVCVTSIWVFYDARARSIPHPYRWSLASILFWIVFFPWYLSRRRTPKASCPVMDESPSRLLRWLIPIFVFFLLFSLIVALLHGPKK